MDSIDKKENFKDYLKETPNFLTVFIFPIFFMTVSPILLEMSASTGISTGDLSLIITFYTISTIIGQLTSVLYNRRFNKITIITTGYILIIIFLILLSFTDRKVFFYLLYSTLGYAAGVIWIQSASYILENKIKNKDRLTTIFLSFYPIGNIVAPFIGSTLIKNGINWRYSYYIIAIFSFVILILFLILKKDSLKKNIQDEERIAIKNIFFNRNLNVIFILGCFLLFFYCISESIMAVWSPTFLRTVKSFDVQYAGLAVSIFWFSVLAGRAIISFFAGKIKANYIILALSVIAIASMSLFITRGTVIPSLISIGFAGLGHSAIITLGISSTSTVYLKGRGVLASIVFAGINGGLSLAPFLTRYISRTSMTLSIVLAPVFMGLTLLFIIIKIIYEKKTLAKGKLTKEL